jgi:hypothetical protein
LRVAGDITLAVMEATLIHECTGCQYRYPLERLPTAGERLFKSSEGDISFDRYVYAFCPECGKKDWASERRYFGVLGPRGFYMLAVSFMAALLGLVYFLGFVWKP